MDDSTDDLARRIALAARRVHYWTRVRRLTLALLGVWLATVTGAVFFARELSHVRLFGWPLSFYMAAQGALLIFLAIIGCYAWRMRRIDAECER